MKMKNLLLLPLICLTWLWAGAAGTADNDYDPVNPGDPAQVFLLRVEASPSEAGTVSPSGLSKVEPGKTVSCSATPRQGYRFICWKAGEEEVSTQSRFSYTMPERNETLTAYFELAEHNPDNPGDPTVQYNLRLEVTPANAGTVSPSALSKVEPSKKITCSATPKQGYRFICWKAGEEEISTESRFSYTMPEHSQTLTAHFEVGEHDPSNPGDPWTNHYDSATGELIIDQFSSGNLSTAIKAALGDSGNAASVKSVIIAGEMTSSSFSALKTLTGCTTVDLSRTTGYSELPAYAFNYDNAIRTLSLPACVTSIGTRAFGKCTAMTDLYLYSPTPPTLRGNALTGLNPDVTVHVPTGAAPLYTSATGWKDLRIDSFSGIGQNAAERMETGIAPTRTAATFTIRSGGEEVSHLEITGMNGMTVMSFGALPADAAVDVSHLPAGIYIVTYTAGNERRTERIVKI